MNITTNTLFIGKVSKFVSDVDSTNNYAQRLISKSNPIEGTAIYTDFQSNGKGQIGSKWNSAPGQNILMSIILKPVFLLPRDQFAINVAFSLAIVSALQKYISNKNDLKIKWPNDIYYKDKKLGGILIENSISSHSILFSVLGLGLNVNQTVFPSSLPNPISLQLIEGKHFERNSLMGAIFENLEMEYLKLKNNHQQSYNAYVDHLFGIGEDRKFRSITNNEMFTGKIINVDAYGRLIVFDHSKARTRLFAFKEIEFVS